VVSPETAWSAERSRLIPLERQTRISRRCGIRGKVDVEIKLSVTGYWPNKATDAGAIGDFILNEHGLIWGNKFAGEES
jgi:hypothetical protein